MNIRVPALALLLGLSSPLVQAQMLQPGLWEPVSYTHLTLPTILLV